MAKITLKNFIQIPEPMFNLMKDIARPPKNTPEISSIMEEYRQKKKENAGFGFKRTIDPIFIGVLYGLYISKELPPQDKKTGFLSNDEIKYDFSYEYNVPNISDLINYTSHALLALWLKENGLPDDNDDINYRERIYDFIENLLDQSANYYIKTLIPFYLGKANKEIMGSQPFLHRLWMSNKFDRLQYELDMGIDAPEYIAQEFNTAQKNFENYLKTKNKNINKNEITIFELLNNHESDKLEFKSSLRWDYDCDKENKSLEEVILKSISSFANSEGGTLIIGVNDQKEPLGLKPDFDCLDGEQDKFERHLRNIVKKQFEELFTMQLKITFPIINKLDICKIEILKWDKPLYLEVKDKNNQKSNKFYVRSGNSSIALGLKEISDYIKKRYDQNKEN